jgi:ribokinase
MGQSGSMGAHSIGRSGSMPHIVVVGSCNIDLVTYAARLPGPGETILGERFAMGFGGKGANQAVMAARLGATVSMIGALGDDVYAEMTLRNFAEQGVETSGIQRVAGSSGLAPIWVEPDGTNRIIVVPGANALVDPGDTAQAVRLADAVDVCVGQLEIPQAATRAGFDAAHARGAVTVLNPAPAAQLDLALLAVTDWLIPNEHEVVVLAGGAAVAENPAAISDAALVEFAGRMGTNIVVTLGAAGAALVADHRVIRLPAAPASVVDTTGAGDAFVGAFAVGLGLGLAPIDAVRLGIACASDSVTRPGTQTSYPDRPRAMAIAAGIRDADRPPG